MFPDGYPNRAIRGRRFAHSGGGPAQDSTAKGAVPGAGEKVDATEQ
jgi:hypothetical protein